MDNGQVSVLGRLIPDSGKIHQNQEVFWDEGIICTIKASHYKSPPQILFLKRGAAEDDGGNEN